MVALRVPFFLTGHIQEDAYIAFRTAANLAETGVYGFNPGERVSSCTSHLYVLLLAVLHRVSPAHFIAMSLVLSTAAVVLACYLLAFLLCTRREHLLRLWICCALAPVSLLTSYAGMELSWVLLLSALALWGTLSARPAWSAAALFLLPWTRPDAVLAALVLVFFAGWMTRKIPFLSIAGLAAGTATLLGFNIDYFGAPLNHTIIAKQIAYHPEHSVQLFVSDLFTVLGRLAIPFHFQALFRWGLLFLVLELAAAGYAVWHSRFNRPRLALVVSLAALCFLPCAAYAAGRIFFPWYLWPSQILLSLLVLTGTFEFLDVHPRLRSPGLYLTGIALCAGMLVQWTWAYSTGIQESKYRAGVGRRLKAISKPTDSIMLEPIGYIPFYAQRYTHDAIGMASPQVTNYRRDFGSGWWIRYVQHFQPTFYLERTHLQSGITLDGDHLSRGDMQWFHTHYEMIESFRYHPEDFVTSRWGLKLAQPRTQDNYDLYRLRTAPSPN